MSSALQIIWGIVVVVFILLVLVTLNSSGTQVMFNGGSWNNLEGGTSTIQMQKAVR